MGLNAYQELSGQDRERVHDLLAGPFESSGHCEDNMREALAIISPSSNENYPENVTNALAQNEAAGGRSKLATLENARDWLQTQEKFVLCIDLLDISVNDADADARVEQLEAAFEAVLVKALNLFLKEDYTGKAEAAFHEILELSWSDPIVALAIKEGMSSEELIVALSKDRKRLINEQMEHRNNQRAVASALYAGDVPSTPMGAQVLPGHYEGE